MSANFNSYATITLGNGAGDSVSAFGSPLHHCLHFSVAQLKKRPLIGAALRVWCFFAIRQLSVNGICLEIYRAIDAHHAINMLRSAAVFASEKSGPNVGAA